MLVVAVVAGALALGASGCGGSSTASSDGGSGRFQGVEQAVPSDKPDFVLTDTEGRPYDFRDETAGKLAILFFGYTSCPDVCPVTLANVAAALDAEPMAAAQAEVVFVGVDPARDTPEAIRSYLGRFSGRFVGLTGTPEQLRDAQLAAGVPPAILEEPGPDGDYLVGHASQVLVYAPDGKGYTVYPFGTRQSQLAHDLAVLAELRPGSDAAAVGVDPVANPQSRR